MEENGRKSREAEWGAQAVVFVFVMPLDFKAEKKTCKRPPKRTSHRHCLTSLNLLSVPFMLLTSQAEWVFISWMLFNCWSSASSLAKSNLDTLPSLLDRCYSGQRMSFSGNFSSGSPCFGLGSPRSFLQSAVATAHSLHPCCPGKVSISEFSTGKYDPPYFPAKKTGTELGGKQQPPE